MKTLLPLSILCLVSLFLCTGCTKTIPVDLGSYDEKVSIESLLMPGTTPRVYLNKTVPFFTPEQTPANLFLSDAEVIITSSDQVVDILQPDSSYNDFYCRYEPFYQGSVVIRENVTYTLKVVHRGRTYTATAVTDVPSVAIESASYVSAFTDIYGGHEGVVVNFVDLPGQDNQYRFRMDRVINNQHTTVDDREYATTCLADGETTIVSDIGRFVYFDTDFDGAPVRFVVEPAHTNRKGDQSTLYIQSLDHNAATYYDVLDRQREANVNPFIEPVFLDSRIEGAIGVFGAMNLSPPFPFVFPEDSQ